LLGCDHFLVYRSIDELQADLDAWITQYDETRPHQGRWCFTDAVGLRALGLGARVIDVLDREIELVFVALVREWQGTTHHVTVTDDGFLWNGKPHRSLSSIARAITGTTWNEPRFFGLRDVKTKTSEVRDGS
jgi:hypothetical protein